MIRAPSASTLWAIVALGSLAAGLYLYLAKPRVVYRDVPGPVKVVAVPKVVEKVTKELVPIKGQIEFFNKERVAEKLDMPELNQEGGGVIAVGEVGPHSGKTTVVSLLGEGHDNVMRGKLIMRQEPSPFFAFQKSFRAEAWWNPVGHNVIEGAIVASPLRIGPIHVQGKVGLNVDGDSHVDAVVGIGIQYQF